MDGGAKRWQVLDNYILSPEDYFDKYDLGYDWHPYDVHSRAVIKSYKHDPEITRQFRTIKEQKEDKRLREEWEREFSYLFNLKR